METSLIFLPLVRSMLSFAPIIALVVTTPVALSEIVTFALEPLTSSTATSCVSTVLNEPTAIVSEVLSGDGVSVPPIVLHTRTGFNGAERHAPSLHPFGQTCVSFTHADSLQ
ncbi:Uncharacterised protein [Candidatus Norongarragalina meridionalis]|nr:Uncharacterised protein [Candidatus Norongarragalina meridionalis]